MSDILTLNQDGRSIIMERKIRIGVLGGYRGSSMINYCERADNAEIVAICDKSEEVLNYQIENLKDDKITYYNNFEDFLYI